MAVVPRDAHLRVPGAPLILAARDGYGQLHVPASFKMTVHCPLLHEWTWMGRHTGALLCRLEAPHAGESGPSEALLAAGSPEWRPVGTRPVPTGLSLPARSRVALKYRVQQHVCPFLMLRMA